MPLVLLGAGILWFGWFGWLGFDAGSAVSAGQVAEERTLESEAHDGSAAAETVRTIVWPSSGLNCSCHCLSGLAEVQAFLEATTPVQPPYLVDNQSAHQDVSGIQCAGGYDVLARTALARAGLANPEVTVDAAAALPRNPETGKLRRVIPA